jgi:hypothetical protein
MTTVGAPVADDRMFLIWTGSKMFALDLADDSERDGGLYDPLTDSWMPISMQGMPLGGIFRPVWTGAEVLVYATDEEALARYDPVRDEWSRTAVAGELCASAIAWTEELVLAWRVQEGWSGSDGDIANRYRFDPATDELTPMTSDGEPSARSVADAVWTGSEMIVWGGSPVVQEEGHDRRETNTGGRYTP